MLEYSLLLISVAVTFGLVRWLAGVVSGRPLKSMREAFFEVMECLGLSVVFMAANVSLCITLVLLMRAITSEFVSLYVVTDLTLIVLSAFEGFLFRLWWRSA